MPMQRVRLRQPRCGSSRIPPGITGVIVFLLVSGTTLNVMLLMGVVMMIGIVVSNSILIVKFTRKLRSEGMAIRDAVAMACRARLRSELKTLLTTILRVVAKVHLMRYNLGSKRLTSMAMGKREDQQTQEPLWVAHTELAAAPGHPFYQKLNELLAPERFDCFVKGLCAKFYAPQFGRPSLLPGIYFRSLLIGYFEYIEGERGIAWRGADSLALRQFLGIALTERTPDHSTLLRTRRLIDLETHQQVFS